MIKTLWIDAPGGPEMLRLASTPTPRPGASEVLVRQTVIGVNFVDIYHRRGLHGLPAYPGIPGVEATGVVEETGEGVTDFALGDRVAYAGLPAGGYAEMRALPAGRLVKLPDDLDDRQVAGSFLRGLTAFLLLKRLGVAPETGQTVLVQAAAGGLGLILVQWLKRLGTTTLGTVGLEEKAEIARRFGLDHAILYKDVDFVAAVKDLTGGAGVEFAIDGVGGETLEKTLASVRPFGIVANVGESGGVLRPLAVTALTNRFLIRPSVLAYLMDDAAFQEAAAVWFAMLRDGLDVSVGQDYAFEEAARAHADLEEGRTSGAVRLVVS